MNKLYKSILAMALLISAISANAQNRCMVDNKRHGWVFEASENTIINKISDREVTLITPMFQPIQIPIQSETSVLKLETIGQFHELNLIGEDKSVCETVFPGNAFCQEVPVGKYYILYTGHTEEGLPGICIYDLDVLAGTDTTIFRCDMEDAQYSLSIIGKDEYGNDLAQKPIDSGSFMFHVHINMAGLDGVLSSSFSSIYNPTSPYRFSTMGNYCTVACNINFTTRNQEAYIVDFPTQMGITGNMVMENDPIQFAKHEEYYRINNEDSLSYYSIGYYCFSNFSYIAFFRWSQHIYDPQKPYTIVMNCIDNGLPCTASNPKTRVAPLIYDSYDMYGQDIYAPHPLAIDTEGRLFYEPFGNFISASLGMPSAPDYLVQTPARRYLDAVMRYGGRTPLVYQNTMVEFSDRNHQAEGYNIYAPTGFIGENGLERVGDMKESICMKANGVEVFNDSVYKFNMYAFNIEEAAEVELNIKNDNIKNDSVMKVNTTTVKYDLSKEDNVPPTFTILQVLDQNTKETIVVDDLNLSQINVAAGDWHVYLDSMYMTHMDYVDGSTVQVYYKLNETQEFIPLEIVEQEELFHINYGKYYSIALSQLQGIDKTWVSLKLVIIDAAGNTQEQILNNLFYVDTVWSVGETEGLSHTVQPNPFSSEVRIVATEAFNGEAQVNVYNILGEQVYAKNASCNNTDTLVIDASKWQSGIYFYQIATDNGIIQGRIVKE